MFERKCGADLTLFFNGCQNVLVPSCLFQRVPNCLVSVVTILKFCTDDGEKMYVIFIQLGMKWEFLLTLKENNSYKIRIIKELSEMCKWSIGWKVLLCNHRHKIYSNWQLTLLMGYCWHQNLEDFYRTWCSQGYLQYLSIKRE